MILRQMSIDSTSVKKVGMLFCWLRGMVSVELTVAAAVFYLIFIDVSFSRMYSSRL